MKTMKKNIVLKVSVGIAAMTLALAGIAGPVAVNINRNAEESSVIADEDVRATDAAVDTEIADDELSIMEDAEVEEDLAEEAEEVIGDEQEVEVKIPDNHRRITVVKTIDDEKKDNTVVGNEQQTVTNDSDKSDRTISTGTGSTSISSTGTGSTNTGSASAGSTGTGSTGTGPTSTGSTGTGSAGAGSTGTGSANSGSANTGSANTGSANTGSANTGNESSEKVEEPEVVNPEPEVVVPEPEVKGPEVVEHELEVQPEPEAPKQIAWRICGCGWKMAIYTYGLSADEYATWEAHAMEHSAKGEFVRYTDAAAY